VRRQSAAATALWIFDKLQFVDLNGLTTQRDKLKFVGHKSRMPSHTDHRFARQVAFLKARLSPEGYLGLHLTAGALIMLGATWLFAVIAADVVTADSLTVIDANFTNWLYARRTPAVTAVLMVVTNFHDTLGASILTLAVFVFMLRRGFRPQALAMVLSVFGGMLLNVTLKHVFLRTRPHFENPILTLTSYGFPSGHTMMATCFYGALGAIAIANLKNSSWRIGVGLVAGFMILLVGFSRIYLGAHYLSDVLGAMAEGLVWLAFCLTSVRIVHHRRRAKKLRA
jgi:undecaprenyl-diphosphatase